MQFKMKRLLVVMDGEGRKLLAIAFEGDKIAAIDAKGNRHDGVLKRVMGDGIIIVEDGVDRMLRFNVIDYFERMKKDEDGKEQV